MNSPAPIGWKSAAYLALADYYRLLEERAAFDAKIEEAKAKCERAGVNFRWGGPEAPSESEAISCACGAIIPLTYEVRQERERHPLIVLTCSDCAAKASAAARADAQLELKQSMLVSEHLKQGEVLGVTMPTTTKATP